MLVARVASKAGKQSGVVKSRGYARLCESAKEEDQYFFRRSSAFTRGQRQLRRVFDGRRRWKSGRKLVMSRFTKLGPSD